MRIDEPSAYYNHDVKAVQSDKTNGMTNVDESMVKDPKNKIGGDQVEDAVAQERSLHDVKWTDEADTTRDHSCTENPRS